MRKKLLFIGGGSILGAFTLGWVAAITAHKHGEFNGIAQAIPIIRFERFDEARKALIIGLYNPGALPMEISRTELVYEANNNSASPDFITNEYGDKPLVLDPGDTILVPLAKSLSLKSKTETGSYWGQLDFRIPGQVDFYSLRHRIDANQPGDINNTVKN